MKRLKTKNLPRKIPKEFIRGYKLKTEYGATAILTATFVLTIILLIALTAASVMIFEIKMAREIANSTSAFFAADAGTEKCLCQVRKNAVFSDCTGGCASVGGSTSFGLDNGASVTAKRTASKKIESTGSFSQTIRKVELNW
ncbi:MAG: hypothetical protein LiPW39_418 [Parcubacteria group bacterium LiPW_39]|nr:MAG: hypothetical protein LiPW39_418 [Parcubacteria group bacterium LiPW_39]